MGKVYGEQEIARILGTKIKERVKYNLNLQQKREAAQEGLAKWATRIIQPTLEQIKAYWAETEKLLEMSRRTYYERRWADYYAQFKPEKNDE